MGKNIGGLPHLIFIILVISFLCNVNTYSWHEPTQFRSKIFRHVLLCSVVHVHERITCFCIILCVVLLPFLFTPHDDIISKIMKGWFIKMQSTLIFIQKYWNNNTVCFQMLFSSLWYYPNHNHYLMKPLPPLSK